MSKKKILYTTPNPELGGVSKYLLEIIKNLPEDIEPFFVTSYKGYFTEELEKMGYKENIYYIKITNLIHKIDILSTSIKKLKEITKKLDIDIICCNTFPASVPSKIVGYLTKIPVIYLPHSWAFQGTKRKIYWRILWLFLEMLFMPLASKVICVSEYEKTLAEKLIPYSNTKLQVIHNGITDINKRLIKSNFSAKPLNVVMISRFAFQKDPYTLIDAVDDLNKNNYDIKLDLYGLGPELNKVKNYIINKNNNNITFVGTIKNAENVLKNYDVYCLITFWEGLPISAIEAIRSGLPIILTDVGGDSELINGNGYLVQPKDKEKIKLALIKLYNNQQRLIEMSHKSRELYINNYTSYEMCKKTFSVYEYVRRK